MVQDGWGAPRIHAELTKLGFIVSEVTVSGYIPRPACRARPSQALGRVLARPQGRHRRHGFVHGVDRVASAAVRLLRHRARPSPHHSLHATFRSSAAWVIQQLREAFPYDTAPRYLIFDRDSIFSAAAMRFIKSMGTKPVRTSFRSPWQHGTAECRIGNCRRELLAHVVVFGERHLVRLVRLYITTTTRIVATWDSKKTRRTRDRSRRDRHPRPRSWRYQEWVAFTIATSGGKLRSAVLVANVAWPEAVTVLAFRSSSPQST